MKVKDEARYVDEPGSQLYKRSEHSHEGLTLISDTAPMSCEGSKWRWQVDTKAMHTDRERTAQAQCEYLDNSAWAHLSRGQ